ncbi:hypothetical protein [Ferruginibacter sp.]
MQKIIFFMIILPQFVFAQTPINDEPCGAVNIPVVAAANCVPTTIYQWANATFSTGGTSNASCGGFGNTSKDVWYKFTTINNNCAILFDKAYAVSHDLAAAVYDAESCTLFYSNQWCNDDDGPANYPQFQFDNLIAGATYYLRVWQYTATTDTGSAKICIVSEPNISPAVGKTGINTNFPSTALDVNGVIKIRGGTPANNKVLTSDAIGIASWKAVPVPTKIAFGTYLLPGSPQSANSNIFTKISFGEPEELGVANISASVFTAPETATYHFETSIMFALPTAADVAVRIVVRDASLNIIRNYETRENAASASTEKSLFVSTTTALSAGQKVEVQFYQNTGTALIINNTGSLGFDRKTRFQGFKIN